MAMLRLPVVGFVVPLRSFYYLGSIQSLFYLPLFLAWPSPVSARFFVMLLFALQAVLYGRLFKLSPYVVFACLALFFPYFFQHLIDTGPVALHLTSIPLIVLLLRRWVGRLEWRYPLTIALIVFLGIWVKLNYLWYVPAIALLAAAEFLFHGRPATRRAFRAGVQAALTLLVVALLCAVLFLSSDPALRSVLPYWDQLVLGRDQVPLQTYFSTFSSLRVVAAFANPLEATQRVFVPLQLTILNALYNLLLYAVLPLLFIVPSLFLRSHRVTALRSLVFYCAFLGTAFVITLAPRAALMHHAVLAFPFLILAAFQLLPVVRDLWRQGPSPSFDKISLFVVSALWVACNVALFLSVPLQTIKDPSTPDRREMFAVLNDRRIAERYVVAVTSWGAYFQKALYGPVEQSVTYVQPVDHQRGGLERAYEMARRSGRKFLVLSNTLDWQDSARAAAIDAYSLRRCEVIDPASPWQAYLETDDDPWNPCFSGGQVLGHRT
jgi:hypothetical protein